MISTDPRIRLEVDGAVALITIVRPEKLNALDAAMIRALGEAALTIDHTPAVRVAILTGDGAKAFSAGGDIAAWADASPSDFHRFWIRDGHRAFAALTRLRVPLIAAINGHALGGGLELAGTADLRIGEAHARFGLPETTLGMVPGWSGSQRLVRRFGAQTVRRMALGGAVFSAQDALTLGIIDALVETGGALTAARAIAAQIAKAGPLAVETAKLMINAADGEDAATALEALGGGLVARTADLAEGVAAFRNKRQADFKGT